MTVEELEREAEGRLRGIRELCQKLRRTKAERDAWRREYWRQRRIYEVTNRLHLESVALLKQERGEVPEPHPGLQREDETERGVSVRGGLRSESIEPARPSRSGPNVKGDSERA